MIRPEASVCREGPASESGGEDSSGEAWRSQCASGQGENGQAVGAARAEALGQERLLPS